MTIGDGNHQEFSVPSQVFFPWLINIPDSWLELVRFLEGYTPRIGYRMV